MTAHRSGAEARRDDRLFKREKTGSAIDKEIRSEFERDVDRIYYNYYFRRLSEVTQVSSGRGPLLHHNRMTHSLKVAQVGRRLVQYLKLDRDNEPGIIAARGIDEDVVTAAGLLHDAGHPPFGHVGEYELNGLALAHGLSDGYEGNAQTLRIILNLVVHTAQNYERHLEYGLNLTRAVVAACVKYPWPREHQNSVERGGKWGYYKPEEDLFKRFVAPALPGKNKVSLEAELMDWADDITYAIHDLQDFYMSGIIPLHHLRHTHRGPVHGDEFNEFWQYVTEKLRKGATQPLIDTQKTFARYALAFPERQFTGKREEISQIGELASRIITDASNATSVRRDGTLYIEPRMQSFVKALKQLTWFYVIDHPDLVSVQTGQRARINQMFEKLLAWVTACFEAVADEEQWILQRRLPTSLREFTRQLLAANDDRGAYDDRKACYARAVIDFIASMTEVEFDGLHGRLCGTSGNG